MQNKPNVKDAQININSYIKSKYEKLDTWLSGKNKPNSNPIKPNLQKAKMNVNLYVIVDYRKKDDFIVRINKPNFRNVQNERKLNFNKGLQKKRLFSSQKTNPIQTQFRKAKIACQKIWPHPRLPRCEMVLAEVVIVVYSIRALLGDDFSKTLLGSDKMRIRSSAFCSISAFFVVLGLAISTGCARKTQALFTRPELITCGRLAVLGLTPEQEQIFMASYTKAFPGQIITFVERNRLQEILSEQDLLQGRLDDRTRAKIKQILGIEALIMCTYYDGTFGAGRKKLRIRIVDSETGAIVGSVITQARDNFEYHCDRAVKALKADLLSGS